MNRLKCLGFVFPPNLYLKKLYLITSLLVGYRRKKWLAALSLACLKISIFFFFSKIKAGVQPQSLVVPRWAFGCSEETAAQQNIYFCKCSNLQVKSCVQLLAIKVTVRMSRLCHDLLGGLCESECCWVTQFFLFRANPWEEGDKEVGQVGGVTPHLRLVAQKSYC